MLPAPRYREQGYPPRGPRWPQFDDPQLEEALTSLSQEMHTDLASKKKDWYPMHMERLQQQSLTPHHMHPPLPSLPLRRHRHCTNRNTSASKTPKKNFTTPWRTTPNQDLQEPIAWRTG